MIEWYKTPKRDKTLTSNRRTWRSTCGHYRVEESEITFGQGKDRFGNETGYPIVFRAMVLESWGWRILNDDYRKRSTAVEALDYYVEHGMLPPKKKRRKKVKCEE